eukprot:gnl/MRDRNA2_/MRDRNA2_124539_c0_seq1.p1 gnl/MRDRNA2_/MRDRNA2_124539_c0~~gnl/MRDRNA2_/MRDRNA2_124539_c0_seq1.p1  ORF type:complete len:342 (+),score=65.73 gnl/MRDRNA2_/MRDRNA2_124539_c0_seq1:105-1130(+)
MYLSTCAMRRVSTKRSADLGVAALRRTMAFSAAAAKMPDVGGEVFGYANFGDSLKQITDLNTVLGPAVLQDPYILPKTEATGDMKALGKELREKGTVIIKGAISKSAMADFAAEHRKLVDMVGPELTSDKMIPRGKNFYKAYSKMEGGLQLRANAPGRFELAPICRRDGGVEVREKTRIAELVEPLVCPPSVAEVMDYAMDTPWRVGNVGSLPTEPNAPCGNWHRDAGSGIFGDEGLEIALPDYFISSLITLEEPLTVHNGTEVVLGSHRMSAVELSNGQRATCTAEPGDVVLINGKTVHRGLPNTLGKARPMVYVTYCAHWFQQIRDISVEYWQTEGLKT